MMNCRGLFAKLPIAIVVLLMLLGCTTEVDYSLGSEFIPSNQQMELHRRVYEKGVMKEQGKEVACRLSNTSLSISDSIPSANLKYGYFGAEHSKVFGERKAGFLSQMLFSLSIHEENGWGYRPIFDSMRISLYVADFHGDTTQKQRFNIYEITSNDYLNLADSAFYINFNPEPYIAKEPIFYFEFPDQENGIYVGDISSPLIRSLRLKETPASRQYIEKLMCMNNMSANGGYALDTDSLYAMGNERHFLDNIRGVYILPAESEGAGEGAIFATQLENTSLTLYSRNRYEEDPTIICDTTYMIYNFFLNPQSYDISCGNVSITTVDHNFEGSKVGSQELGSEVLIGYVDGMGGVVTELSFTDEFLLSLAELIKSREDSVIAVNQARLSIYLEGADYDYMSPSIMELTEVMNDAMPRVGLYGNYNRLTVIPDYLYTAESSQTIPYDGYLNRSLGCYTMDISGFVQLLLENISKNIGEDGTLALDKFSADYEPKSESLVDYRRMYVGPDATSLLGMKHQAIYGTDGEIGGEKNRAPIKLEMTYTIVN